MWWSVICFFSAVSPTHEAANIITPIVMSLLLLFGGLFVNIDHVPVYFRWIEYINFVKYSYESRTIRQVSFFVSLDVVLAYNDMYGLELTCDTKITIPAGDRKFFDVRISSLITRSIGCLVSTGTEVLEQMSMADVSIPFNFLYLAVLTVVFHIGAYLALRFSRPINI